MFKRLIDDARLAAAALVEKYLVRASVAVAFVVAAGFATAAAALALTERYGATKAFWIMAIVFGTGGLLAAAVVTKREREQEQQEAAAEEQRANETSELGEMASAAATQAATHAATHLPATLLLSLLGNPAASVRTIAHTLARNIPLVVLLAFIALLFSMPEDADAAERGGNEERSPPEDTGEPALPDEEELEKAA